MRERPDSPDVLFDAMRDRPDWGEDQREAAFSRLVECFDPDVLLAAAEARTGALDGEDAEAVLRIIEAHGDEDSFEILAQAALSQDLPADRLWEVLSVLEGTEAFDRHETLAEWWEDLQATFDQPSLLEELLAQLEDSDEGCRLALQGLDGVEPEIRAEIVAELGEVGSGPGLVEFLRLLAFALDPITRGAALDALESQDADEPHVAAAWRSIVQGHDDPETIARARAAIEAKPTAGFPARLAPPRLARAFVSTVAGDGRGVIVLFSHDAATGDWIGAAYLCDAMEGVVEVVGHVVPDEGALKELFEDYIDPTRGALPGEFDSLALGLLAWALAATGPEASPSLRYWVERTAGASFRARPSGIHDLFGDWDPADVPFAETPERSEAILDALPDWVDRSEATREIAREVALRASDPRPDPKRDAGAYRYLFEHRLVGRLETYRRMLYWMAAVWRAEGEEYLGRSAQALAWQLSDPQHAVPSHPFLVVLTSRSLEGFLSKQYEI